MAELVQPQLGHRIADPACGTGGFLLGGYQYMVTQLALTKGTKNLQADEDGFKTHLGERRTHRKRQEDSQ